MEPRGPEAVRSTQGIVTEDTSTLRILETLSDSADLAQRDIAARTGLNLSKVNFVLKRLSAKGYIKLKRIQDNPHKLRYLYLLTPDGVAAKSRLAYLFLQATLKQYGQVERRVADSVESMAARGIKRVVLWGNTEITDLCLRVIRSMHDRLEVVAVADAAGKHLLAVHPEQVAGLDADAVVVCETEAAGLPRDLPIWKLV